MKKSYLVILIIILLIISLLFVRFVIGGDEDSWIKDSNGVYVKHGNPAETPDYVLEQQRAITQAQTFYNNAVMEGAILSSQCLGSFNDYAFDMVNIPRTKEDDKAENQCEDYRDGLVKKFIELDKYGNIVKVQ
ncbi:MAG: hypothetical protein Q7K54_05150 [Candidatus Parcubacteria bacterium]|nr:hypothetical protein [Candidatus Parcubacteria bacterium]